MCRLHYSPESRNDLAEIKEYISEEYDNPGAAGCSISNVTTFLSCLASCRRMIQIDSRG